MVSQGDEGWKLVKTKKRKPPMLKNGQSSSCDLIDSTSTTSTVKQSSASNTKTSKASSKVKRKKVVSRTLASSTPQTQPKQLATTLAPNNPPLPLTTDTPARPHQGLPEALNIAISPTNSHTNSDSGSLEDAFFSAQQTPVKSLAGRGKAKEISSSSSESYESAEEGGVFLDLEHCLTTSDIAKRKKDTFEGPPPLRIRPGEMRIILPSNEATPTMRKASFGKNLYSSSGITPTMSKQSLSTITSNHGDITSPTPKPSLWIKPSSDVETPITLSKPLLWTSSVLKSQDSPTTPKASLWTRDQGLDLKRHMTLQAIPIGDNMKKEDNRSRIQKTKLSKEKAFQEIKNNVSHMENDIGEHKDRYDNGEQPLVVEWMMALDDPFLQSSAKTSQQSSGGSSISEGGVKLTIAENVVDVTVPFDTPTVSNTNLIVTDHTTVHSFTIKLQAKDNKVSSTSVTSSNCGYNQLSIDPACLDYASITTESTENKASTKGCVPTLRSSTGNDPSSTNHEKIQLSIDPTSLKPLIFITQSSEDNTSTQAVVLYLSSLVDYPSSIAIRDSDSSSGISTIRRVSKLFVQPASLDSSSFITQSFQNTIPKKTSEPTLIPLTDQPSNSRYHESYPQITNISSAEDADTQVIEGARAQSGGEILSPSSEEKMPKSSNKPKNRPSKNSSSSSTDPKEKSSQEVAPVQSTEAASSSAEIRTQGEDPEKTPKVKHAVLATIAETEEQASTKAATTPSAAVAPFNPPQARTQLADEFANFRNAVLPPPPSRTGERMTAEEAAAVVPRLLNASERALTGTEIPTNTMGAGSGSGSRSRPLPIPELIVPRARSQPRRSHAIPIRAPLPSPGFAHSAPSSQMPAYEHGIAGVPSHYIPLQGALHGIFLDPLTNMFVGDGPPRPTPARADGSPPGTTAAQVAAEPRPHRQPVNPDDALHVQHAAFVDSANAAAAGAAVASVTASSLSARLAAAAAAAAAPTPPFKRYFCCCTGKWSSRHHNCPGPPAGPPMPGGRPIVPGTVLGPEWVTKRLVVDASIYPGGVVPAPGSVAAMTTSAVGGGVGEVQAGWFAPIPGGPVLAGETGVGVGVVPDAVAGVGDRGAAAGEGAEKKKKKKKKKKRSGARRKSKKKKKGKGGNEGEEEGGEGAEEGGKEGEEGEGRDGGAGGTGAAGGAAEGKEKGRAVEEEPEGKGKEKAVEA